MGILHALAELTAPAIITLGEDTLRVGQSDRDAAVALLKFVDDYVKDGETSYGDAETMLMYNLLHAIDEVSESQDFMEDERVRVMLDSLWWFRFLMASRPEDEQDEGAEGEDTA